MILKSLTSKCKANDLGSVINQQMLKKVKTTIQEELNKKTEKKKEKKLNINNFIKV